jgi:hydrogenase-4 component F
MLLSLVYIPFAIGILTFFITNVIIRRTLFLITAFFHFLTTIYCSFFELAQIKTSSWFLLDPLARLFLLVTTLLFLGCSIYAIAYLKNESKAKLDWEQGPFFKNIPEAFFLGLLLLFLSTTTLVTISRHFGILWIAMEATTLFTAPLIYFHRSAGSLEATWKYLLICSVGIALAFLGNLFLAAAFSWGEEPFLIDNLIKCGNCNTPLLKIAFLFFFVGYGTKMGLFPMHTWLPDAHSEAPSIVSALLSGTLLNTAFLCILRIYQILNAVDLASFAQQIFWLFGLLSILFASFMLLKQSNYKRMLAYSSIENMGILSLGIGLGNSAIFAIMIQLVGHSLIKGSLFLTSGNFLSTYNSKLIKEVNGALKIIPSSSIIWLFSFFALIGTPPALPFVGKLLLIKEAILQKDIVTICVFFLALSLIFIGMAKVFLNMTQGKANITILTKPKRAELPFIISQICFLLIIFLIGVYSCDTVTAIFKTAAAVLGGKPCTF